MTRHALLVVFAAHVVIACIPVLAGQSAADGQRRKAFEAVAVRPKDPKLSLRPSSRVTPTQFEWVSVTARDMLARAFNVEPFQIAAPEWARTDRFEIRAVLPAGTSASDIPAMLHTLLLQRFSLRMHIEARPTQVHELRVGPAGPQFEAVPPVDDLRKDVTIPSGALLSADRVSGLPGDELREVIATGGSYRAITAQTSYAYRSLPGGARELDAERITMAEFVTVLAQSFEEPVVDRTGLSGIYRFKTLVPSYLLPVASRARLADRLSNEPTGLDLSRSLETLGLKLELKTISFDFLVIDAITRPTLD